MCAKRREDAPRTKSGRISHARTEEQKAAGTWWRLVPKGGCTCYQCMMIASAGYKFKDAFIPHSGCDCQPVQGSLGEYGEADGCGEYGELAAAFGKVDNLVNRLGLGEDFGEMLKGILASDIAVEEVDHAASLLELMATMVSGNDPDMPDKVKSVLSRFPVYRFGPEKGKRVDDYFSIEDDEVAEKFSKAIEYLPTKWLRKLGKRKVSVEVIEPDGPIKRSGYSKGVISFVRTRDQLTAVHEMIHAAEESCTTMAFLDSLFFNSRTDGRKKIKLSEIAEKYKDIDRGRIYQFNPNEYAYDLGLTAEYAYAYKDYEGAGFEVTTRGVECLYRDPKGLLSNDPKLFLFTVLTMMGV